MSKKKPTKKGSSKSNKETTKKEDKIDLSEYEDSFDGDGKAPDRADLTDYEVPDDFEVEDDIEVDISKLNWTQKQIKKLRDLDNNQRLYWIKILLGCLTGVIIGLAGAKTGWWLLLMLGVYGAVTAGGYFLFKLDWNFKEVIFSGFFPYLALFTLTWVLMFSSLYAPPMEIWYESLRTTFTEIVNGSEVIYTSTRTTSAAGFPFYSIILAIISAAGLMQYLLRIQKRREEKR